MVLSIVSVFFIKNKEMKAGIVNIDQGKILKSKDFSVHYIFCEVKPTSKCLTKLAVEALPKDYMFGKSKGLAEYFSHSGRSDLVISRISPKAKDFWKKFIKQDIARINLFETALISPKSIDSLSVKMNASDHYISTLWSIYDHHRYGGGMGIVVDVEEKLFSKRKPIPFESITTLLKHWEKSIEREPIKRHQYGWTNMAWTLLEFGYPKKAKATALQATKFPIQTSPKRLVLILGQLSEIKNALKIANQIEKPKYRAYALLNLERIISENNLQTRLLR